MHTRHQYHVTLTRQTYAAILDPSTLLLYSYQRTHTFTLELI